VGMDNVIKLLDWKCVKRPQRLLNMLTNVKISLNAGRVRIVGIFLHHDIVWNSQYCHQWSGFTTSLPTSDDIIVVGRVTQCMHACLCI